MILMFNRVCTLDEKIIEKFTHSKPLELEHFWQLLNRDVVYNLSNTVESHSLLTLRGKPEDYAVTSTNTPGSRKEVTIKRESQSQWGSHSLALSTVIRLPACSVHLSKACIFMSRCRMLPPKATAGYDDRCMSVWKRISTKRTMHCCGRKLSSSSFLIRRTMNDDYVGSGWKVTHSIWWEWQVEQDGIQ